MTNVCLDGLLPVCATDLIVYAVEKATPWFNILADGYLGLAPTFKGRMNDTKHTRNNVLEQMHFHKMINHKVFGVHTHMFNSTEDPSQIRFGGYNKDLVREGHEFIYINTTSTHSWAIELTSAKLHHELTDEGEKQLAIIDPAYPYMAMPKTAFAKFSEVMKTEYPNEPITCETLDWCYFYTPCEDVSKLMSSLTFTVKNSAGEDVELKIPAKSFLYQDVDYKTKLSTCHVGIVA